MAELKTPKDVVNYRTAPKCSTCDLYREGMCLKVRGGISSESVCDEWRMRTESPGGMDGEFYKQEYDKKIAGYK